MADSAVAYPIFAQQNYANPQDPTGKIACANCHLQSRGIDARTPHEVLPDTIFKMKIEIPAKYEKRRQLNAEGEKVEMNVGAIAIMPEGFKLPPKDRLPKVLKKEMKGLAWAPYSKEKPNIVVAGPVPGARYETMIVPVLAPDPNKQKDVYFDKYTFFFGGNRGRGQVYPEGNQSNNNVFTAKAAGTIQSIEGEGIKEITIAKPDGTTVEQEVLKGADIVVQDVHIQAQTVGFAMGCGCLTGRTRKLSKASSKSSIVRVRAQEDLSQPEKVEASTKYITFHDEMKLTGFVSPARSANRFALKSLIAQSELFGGLSEVDKEVLFNAMVEVPIRAGERVFRRGDEGDGLYLVGSGRLECYLDKSGVVLKSCGQGDIFGELSLLLSRPRALTVRASEPSTLWKLDVETWNLISSDFDFGQVGDSIMKKYAIADAVMQPAVAAAEVVDFARFINRPKKTTISFHSAVGTVLFGVALLFLADHWEPQMNAYVWGGPALFNNFTLSSRTTQNALSVLLIITGVTGMLRLPKKVPDIRARSFAICSWCAVLGPALANSSMGVASNYWFDAFDWPGRLLLTSLILGTAASNYLFLYESCGVSQKGRDTVPLMDPPFVAVGLGIIVTFPLLNAFVQLPLLTLWFADPTAFIEILANSKDLSAFLVSGWLIPALMASLIAFPLTLVLGGKISLRDGGIGSVFMVIVLFYDVLAAAPELFPGGRLGVVIEGYVRSLGLDYNDLGSNHVIVAEAVGVYLFAFGALVSGFWQVSQRRAENLNP